MRYPVSHSQPEYTQAELQRSALAHMRSLETVRAPDSLHRSIERMASDAAALAPRRRMLRLPSGPALRPPAGRALGPPGGRALRPPAGRALGPPGGRALRPRLAGAGALAAAAVAVVAILLGSGGQPAPTVLDASRVALAPATLASPAEDPRDRSHLEASVEGLPYPYWGDWRGWPAAGARRDRLGGRSITTVFYAAHGGARIGYAIVAGRPLPEPSAGTALNRGGVRFRVLDAAGATIVTWREAGHTCILAARGVDASTMVRLVLS
jgi:hypothetical protein